MPELPEVERARKLIEDSCKGYKIKRVDAKEDKIVFCGGTDHVEFGKEIEGRTIEGCERKGKMFWMHLSGKGRLPIMHFGMTGMIQLKGQEPTWYRRRPKERTDMWPPKFYKFILELEPQPGSVGAEPRALAFIDARRLGRVRLLPSPVLSHPPLSDLGFDPVLAHPSIDEFKELLGRKKGTVKGVIMDQAFSAGVGNWVADEVLYQAQIHPACPVPMLSDQNVIDLHHQLRNVPITAIGVNADSTQFPEGWLFRWRWDKGKGMRHASGAKGGAKLANPSQVDDELAGEDIKPKGKEFMTLPDGRPATITFIEVGGRTTAVVNEVQKMPSGVEIKPKVTKGGKGKRKTAKEEESELESDSSLTDIEEVKPHVPTTPRQKAIAKSKTPAKTVQDQPATKAKGSKRAKAVKEEPDVPEPSTKQTKASASKPAKRRRT